MASDSSWPHAAPPDSVQLGSGPGPVGPPAESALPWDGWDVLRMAVLTVAMIFAFALVFTIGTQKLLYPRLSMMEVAKFPLVSVLGQLVAYVVVLLYMYSVATRGGQGFLKAVSWNWPPQPLLYLGIGIVVSIALQLLGNLLPMPKSLPIEQFFKTPLDAWVLSLFGVTFAPLLEELFFRGFLYPVLERRLGVFAGVFLTALAFSLIHAPQLARAWGPVFLIFLIGLALTVVRVVTKSVSAGILMHIAYNGTISALLYHASDGFRHLEKITQ